MEYTGLLVLLGLLVAIGALARAKLNSSKQNVAYFDPTVVVDKRENFKEKSKAEEMRKQSLGLFMNIDTSQSADDIALDVITAQFETENKSSKSKEKLY